MTLIFIPEAPCCSCLPRSCSSPVLSGLVFFVMGRNYWGRCYAIGAAFFILAALMPLHLEWAPITFGMFWSVTLALIGLHLRRVGKRVEAEKARTEKEPG